MARKLTGRPAGRPAHPGILTPAEERVLAGVRDGLTNGEIAVRLGISLDGVKFHVSNMLGKLQLESREELARWKAPHEGLMRRAWGTVPLVARLAAGVGGVAVAGLAVAAMLAGDGDASPTPTLPLEDGLASVAMDGRPAAGGALALSMSGDGRYVVFSSDANNLVPSDTNEASDIFLRDRALGSTIRVSVGPAGEQANAQSELPAISRDGRYVAYVSIASNIVAGAPVLPPARDDALAALSADLRQVMAISRTPAPLLANVFRYDTQTRRTELVSVALNGGAGLLGSSAPAISADGRYVAFDSIAPNLVSGDTNAGEGGLMGDQLLQAGGCDVFVRDMQERRTVRVSIAADGSEATGSSSYPAISGDGRVVAFLTDAGNVLPGVPGAKFAVVRDLKTGKTRQLEWEGTQALWIGVPAISEDGQTVVTGFGGLVASPASQASGMSFRISVFDRRTGKTRNLDSQRSEGAQTGWGPALSGDGRLIADWYGAPLDGLELVNVDGSGTIPVAPVGVSPPALGTTARAFFGLLSSDGAQVAFVTPDALGQPQVYAQHR